MTNKNGHLVNSRRACSGTFTVLGTSHMDWRAYTSPRIVQSRLRYPKGVDPVSKAVQLDLFTGEPIETVPVQTREASVAKTKHLALQVQLSIARMDSIRTTMKLVNELCEQLSGIRSIIDIETHTITRTSEPVETTQPKRTESQPKPTRGRPKGTPSRKDIPSRNARIRQRFYEGKESQTAIAKDTGLSPTTIHHIVHQIGGQQ